MTATSLPLPPGTVPPLQLLVLFQGPVVPIQEMVAITTAFPLISRCRTGALPAHRGCTAISVSKSDMSLRIGLALDIYYARLRQSGSIISNTIDLFALLV
jgi:hypothetical protein